MQKIYALKQTFASLTLSLSSRGAQRHCSGSGGGDGGGSGQQLAAKKANSKSVDGRMTACNYKSRQRTTTQQPTIGISKSGQ
jgi:hypothetical protein